jgi:hypothetical protein
MNALKPSTKTMILGPEDSEYAEFSSMKTLQLKSELAKALSLSALALLRLATIVRILEERGEDLSDLKIGLLGHLRKIAYGQLLPEIVVRFVSTPSMMKKIAELPIPDQAHLAEGGKVKLVIKGPHGWTNRMADPLLMPYELFRQVFGPRGIRDEAEQILVLEAKSNEKPTPEPTVIPNRVKADRKKGGIRIGNTFVTAAEVTRAMADLYESKTGGEAEANLTQKVSARVSEGELEKLSQAASNGNTRVTTLVRRALIAYGLI